MKSRFTSIMVIAAMLVATMAFAAPAFATNLVVNGDFELGNTGFTSGYGYVSAVYQNSLQPPLVYAVGTNPNLYHSGWSSFGDHGTGTGKMMIVNGTTTEPPAVVWGQEVTLPAAEPVETKYPLFAGQTWPVGEIIVTNADGKVCVEYKLFDSVLAGGWRLTETHLAVATTVAGIPQTKTGNPIPGAFPYGDTFDPGVPSAKYCVEMPCTPGSELVIAAHAVVNKPSTSHLETGSFCAASGASTKMGDAYTPAALAWVHPGWNSNLRDAVTNAPSDLYNFADWVWGSEYTLSPRDGELVNLYQEFNIPDGATITSGQLQIAGDNGFSWKLNTGVYTDVNLQGDWRTQSVFSYPTYVMDPLVSAWKKVYTYDVKDQLSASANALYVTGVNSAWDTDDPKVNPGGVLYKLCGTWEKEVSDNNSANDSAWGGEEPFKGKNWAKYMKYTCQAPPSPPTYALEFYAKSSYNDPAPAKLEVKINGVYIPPVLNLVPVAGGWSKYTATWSAGTATSALIEIRDLTIAYSGNDFCIDDISFVKQ